MLICDCWDEMEILAELSHHKEFSSLFVDVIDVVASRKEKKTFGTFFPSSPSHSMSIYSRLCRRLHVIGIFDNVQRVDSGRDGENTTTSQRAGRRERKLIKFTPSLKFVFRLLQRFDIDTLGSWRRCLCKHIDFGWNDNIEKFKFSSTHLFSLWRNILTTF